MTLNYNVNEEDLFRWYQYSFRASPVPRAARKRHMLFWFAAYVSFASVVVLAFQTYTAALVGYGLAGVLMFGTRRVYDDRIEATLKAQAADPQVKGSLGEAHLTLSQVGMREITPAADSTIKWQSVIDVALDGDYVFVRLSTGQAAVISRRSFSGPVAFEDIPKLIHDFRQKHVAEPNAPPNSGAATPLDNSGVEKGPPSMS